MNIQEHLSTFDGWLTTRIEEAHAVRKDLAFRDLAEEDAAGQTSWEYSLLEPGARSPHGEGWSIYRFSGVMPDLPETPETSHEAPVVFQRRSLFGLITAAVRKRGPQRG